MEDVYKSVKAYLYDRSVSPLLGGFILSWLVWNYRFILVVFSSESVLHKLNIIESLYSSPYYLFGSQFDISAYYFTGLAFPFLTVVFFIYFIPFLSVPIYEKSLATKNKLNESRLKHYERRTLTREESQHIIQRLHQASALHENQVKELEDDIKNLSELNAKLESSRPDESKILIEKAYCYFLKNIIKLPGGSQFAISDLLKGYQEAYSSYSTVEALEERFYNSVESGEFSNITLDPNKDSRVYHLSLWENRLGVLSLDEEFILKHFVDEESNSISVSRLESDLYPALNTHRIKLSLSKLVAKQYLKKAAHPDGSLAYDLLDSAHEHIIAKKWV